MVAEPQPLRNFLAELLAEQGQLQTPVARFSVTAKREPTYRDLIPLTKPGPGEQYAFEVDLDSCSGCKACVVACHSLNGLEESESWRDVGLIHGCTHAAPFQQTVTTACHHCADPACLNGCPVLAYEKDPVTGIVRHLDDQCIGCQYCVLKCPYDVPKYSERLGIVRKCDMCHHRLAEGEAPACVQACPTEAIKIVKIELHAGPTPRADTGRFLPLAPDPAYTQPTTRYMSRQPLPANAAAADEAALRPQPPHWPLVVMLTLLPMAVGSYAVATSLVLIGSANSATYHIALNGWLAGAAGLGASVFHLGQPARAWRIFLGWRKSWLSREALVLGAWLPLATAALRLPTLLPPAVLLGSIGLFCSVMIYVDTHREFWRLANTAPRFFGSAAVLGLAGALTVPGTPQAFGLALATALLGKISFESSALHSPAAARSALLLLSPQLRAVNELRVAAAVLGGLLSLLPLAIGANPAVAWLTLGLVLAGEFAERYLFFRAVDAPKMPGSVKS